MNTIDSFALSDAASAIGSPFLAAFSASDDSRSSNGPKFLPLSLDEGLKRWSRDIKEFPIDGSLKHIHIDEPHFGKTAYHPEFLEKDDILLLDCRTFAPDEETHAKVAAWNKKGVHTVVFYSPDLTNNFGAQANARRLVESGSIMIGPNNLEIPQLFYLVNDYASTSSSIEQGLRNLVDDWYRPVIGAHRVHEIFRFLVEGGVAELGDFAYCNYDRWKAIKSSPNYKPLASAAQKSELELSSSIVEEIRRRDIKNIYSMGPSPEIDKVILELAARRNLEITYHPIDISMTAINDSMNAISSHLDNTFGKSLDWRRVIILKENEVPTYFSDVNPQEAACVLYFGGQLVNSPDFMQQLPRIIKNNGIAAVSTHNSGSAVDHSRFWLDIYDIPEEKEMFESAVQYMLPGLFSQQNRSKWDIRVDYLHSTSGNSRVSFQLDVHENIETCFYGARITLEPGKQRELMISMKSTDEAFRAAYQDLGMRLIDLKSVKIRSKILDLEGKATSYLLSV